MKKVIKKKLKSVSATPETVVFGEVTGTAFTPSEKVGIDKLTISFPNEDLNKLVEKINQLIDKANDTI